MFRSRNKKNKDKQEQAPSTQCLGVGACPQSVPNAKGNDNMPIQLPFLMMNSDVISSPTILKHTKAPVTPATVNSMTPVATSSNINNDTRSKQAYVDLDSSVDSEDDSPCVPAVIDADVQAMLSPLQSIMSEQSPANHSSQIYFNDKLMKEEEESVESETYDFEKSGATSNSRIGISRPSYSPSCVENDVSHILNARTTETYTNANDNEQFRRDQQYQQKVNANLSISQVVGQMGISAFPNQQNDIPSSSFGNIPVQGANINIQNDDSSVASNLSNVLDNDRFIHPGQIFPKKERSLPLLHQPQKGNGLGITPPPKTRSARVIVPNSTPPSSDTYTIHILVIQPAAKMFELIRVSYRPATATIGDIMKLIPENVMEKDLKSQTYIGLCRPNGSSPSNRSITNMNMTASVMTRDGTDARIVCGELLVAIPEGYNGKESQILAKHILKLPKMKKVLNRSSPTKASKKRFEIVSDMSSLGIQPMNKSNYDCAEAGTFSSSILFAPLSSTIAEEIEQKEDATFSPKNLGDHLIASRNFLNHSIAHDDDDYSIDSRSVSSRVMASRARAYAPVQTPTRVYSKSSVASKATKPSMGLNSEQIEQIKKEAAAAARREVEQSFSNRLEELVDTLKISIDDRAKILDICSPEKAFPVNVQINTEKSPSVSVMSTPLCTPRVHSEAPNVYPVPVESAETLTPVKENKTMDQNATSIIKPVFDTALEAVSEFMSVNDDDEERKMALKGITTNICILLLSSQLESEGSSDSNKPE